jgi:branched-chain amino acid transport system ATP-binding protein
MLFLVVLPFERQAGSVCALYRGRWNAWMAVAPSSAVLTVPTQASHLTPETRHPKPETCNLKPEPLDCLVFPCILRLTMTDSPILEVTDVNVFYGAIHALRDVSLRVMPGEVVTLIGANGAGKTTTLATICGLLRPRTGTVLYQGKDVTRTGAAELVHRGLVMAPEGRGIFPALSVEENLTLGAYCQKDRAAERQDRARAFEIFPRLAERRKQKGGTLSGGEQQMLAIARALMARPRLLLLDEPSLGLAPLIVQTIFETIDAVNREGVTVLLVEQNANIALKHSHRAYVIESGSVAIEGSSRELLTDPRIKAAYLGEG